MFLPCYIFFTHFEFAAKFIYRCISPDISSVFFHVYETIKYWRGIFRYWKLGGFHVTILIEEQPLYHTFSSPPLQRRRKCTRAKSSKTLPLVMILCLGLLCAIPNIVNLFWKLYWILRFHAVETKFCDLCLHLWSVSYRQACVYFWKPLRGRSESAS